MAKIINKIENHEKLSEIVAQALGENATINHPSHYSYGKIEVIDVIEDWDLNFCLGNVIKYVGRSGHKKSKIEDLKKAEWYLKREIETLEKKNNV